MHTKFAAGRIVAGSAACTLARLLGSSAWGGYLWVGYFNGYSEDLLGYNKRQHWMARIGYSIAR